MKRWRPGVRVRLAAAYALLFCLSTGLVLAGSSWLLGRHLDRTLPDALAAEALADVRAQYVLGFAGALLLAVAGGWLLAGRALAPLGRIAGTARRVTGERLDERVALGGPADELREVADALDRMLDDLAESFDAERRFTANASHELRGPLTVIRSEAEVTLADPDAGAEELRAMGEAVVQASRRIEALLEGLMALARSRRELLRREEVDLAASARAAASAVAERARALDIRVRLDTPPAPAVGDARLVDRMVSNLVENAVLHNERGGTVDVRARLTDDGVCLRVENTGPVLPAAEVERLTLPFERLDNPARLLDEAGAGLGLSIVRSVCEAHGGRLALAPRAGGGLVAEVVLPATDAARRAA